MRVLLLSPLGRQREYFLRESSEEGHPNELNPRQAQYYWVQALRTMDHDVRVERYTDCALVDQETVVRAYNRVASVSETFAAGLRKLRYSVPEQFDPDIHRRNERIVRSAVEFDPDVVLVVGSYDQLRPSTFERLHERTTATIVGLNGVGPFDFAADSVERRIAPKYYDVMFVNDTYRKHMWQSLGVPTVVLPVVACNPEFFRRHSVEDEQYQADVSFVGQPYPRRVQFLDAIADLDIDLALYGPRWNQTPLAAYHRGEAWGGEMVRAIHNSTLSINVHSRYMLSGGNLKLFEIPAAGTLQIADTNGEDWFEADEEIIVAERPADLREAVECYLNDAERRERIVAAGRERAFEEHTYENRMGRIVEWVVEGHANPDAVVGDRYLDEYSRVGPFA